MTKEQMKRNADKHVESCAGVKKNPVKGYRESAWAECKALEMIVKLNKEV